MPLRSWGILFFLDVVIRVPEPGFPEGQCDGKLPNESRYFLLFTQKKAR